MSRTIGDRIKDREIRSFVGRTRELAQLKDCLSKDGPVVTYVHGIAGMGKSTLLRVFAHSVSTVGIRVILLDCQSVEPTEQGLLAAFNQETGQHFTSMPEMMESWNQSGESILLALDTYEAFRFIDAYIRQEFVSSLQDNVRVFLFSKEPPAPGWVTSPGWQGLFRVIPLEALESADSQQLLVQCGVHTASVERAAQLADGHPLALRLTASALVQSPALKLEELQTQHLVQGLSSIFLKDIKDPESRRILEAASVVRRVTRSLLKAMLPDIDPVAAQEQLNALPFTTISPDGLLIHSTVKQAIEAQLKITDPNQYMEYRRRAWQQLKKELAHTYKTQLWRYTADMIYMIDNNTSVRPSFLPMPTNTPWRKPGRSTAEKFGRLPRCTMENTMPDTLLSGGKNCRSLSILSRIGRINWPDFMP